MMGADLSENDFSIGYGLSTVSAMTKLITIEGLTNNVGIGLTQPNETLHVKGNVNVTGNLYVEGCIKYDCDDGTCDVLGDCI